MFVRNSMGGKKIKGSVYMREIYFQKVNSPDYQVRSGERGWILLCERVLSTSGSNVFARQLRERKSEMMYYAKDDPFSQARNLIKPLSNASNSNALTITTFLSTYQMTYFYL